MKVKAMTLVEILVIIVVIISLFMLLFLFPPTISLHKAQNNPHIAKEIGTIVFSSKNYVDLYVVEINGHYYYITEKYGHVSLGPEIPTEK